MKTRLTGYSTGMSPTSIASPTNAAKAYSATAAPHTIKDKISIMGIPETELTPKVRQAIMTLMEEMENLRRSIDGMSKRLAAAEKLADQDPLLPIYNRRAFLRELIRVQASVERYNSDASMIYIDLDSFKEVNDTYGHRAGDYVLQKLSERLVASVRETDIVGRLGGDEFGLILSRTNQDAASILANRLPQDLRDNPISWNGVPLEVGMSCGIVMIKPGIDVHDTMAQADDEMYRQKQKEKKTQKDF